MASILVVEDEEGVREFLVECLQDDDHDVHSAVDGQDGLDTLRRRGFDVVLTDLKMPRVDGMELLRTVRAEQPEVEVVMLTAHGGVESAIEATKLGVMEYLEKPVDSPAALRLVVRRAAERRQLRTRAEASRGDEPPPLSFGAAAMAPVMHALDKVAPTEATVLLLGESGTGKEVAARRIHGSSRRCDGPFSAVNCAALSESLLESELFGHEKGAFTGAAARRRGRLELAAGGTFFLDEVGELAPAMQAKLLRVLQERTYERVGGIQSLAADVRWVAATNRDLDKMVREGSFREDLFHRLSVFPVKLPPLRERLEDIVPLAESLLLRATQGLRRAPMVLQPSAYSGLKAHHWPGNVRELANTLERAAILADGDTLGAELLSLAMDGRASSPEIRSVPRTLAEIEAEAIRTALARYDGNRRQAAEELAIGERTLYDKIKRLGLR
ncbi:MAG: sigma-54-dependent transcriptional regulator [Nannocystales bacterium]